MKGYRQGGQKNPVDFVLNFCCIVQLSSASWGGVVLVKLAVLVTSYVSKYKNLYILNFSLGQQSHSGVGRLIFEASRSHTM